MYFVRTRIEIKHVIPFEAKRSAPNKTAPPKKSGCRIKQEGCPACKGSNPVVNGKHGNKVRRNGVFKRFSSGNCTELTAHCLETNTGFPLGS